MNHLHLHHEINVRASSTTRLANASQARASTGIIGRLCREISLPGCTFAGGLIDELQGALTPQEGVDIAGAVPKRVREFIAGRSSARLALAQLGLNGTAIPRGDSREPVWPLGITGSISHNSRYCVAVAARGSSYSGIGIDIENAEPLPRELAELICTPEEHMHSNRQSMLAPGVFAKLMFSAKESVYKCLFPVFSQQLEFEDVLIKPRLYMGQFTAYLRSPELDGIGPVRGRFALRDGLLMTIAALPASSVTRLRITPRIKRVRNTQARGNTPARGDESSLVLP